MIEIIVENNRGVIKGKFESHHYPTFRGFPGARRWREKDMLFELSGANV